VASVAALTLVILWALVGCQASTSSTGASASVVQPQPTSVTALPSGAAASSVDATLAELVDRLVVSPEHLDGYERDLFPHWTDDDGDGCNTRYEVLLAEAIVAPSVSGTCDVTGGMWLSSYDGVEINDAGGVQIDHLVALAEAWYSGAFSWTTDQRERFANDLGVPWALNAVSPDANQAKGSDDPAEWLPPRPSALCPYVEAWVGMKVRWNLTIDPAEEEALETLALGCPESRITVPLGVPSTF